MPISLTAETQQAEPFDELDAETQSALNEAEAQYQRGEARPWEHVREELRHVIDRK